MVSMTWEEAKNYIKTQSPAAFLQFDKKRKGFICPECGNGSGEDGTGIKKDPHSPNEMYKCFVCNFRGDIFALIGSYFKLPEFIDQFNKAKEIYGVEVVTTYRNSKGGTTQMVTSDSTSTSITAYFDKCHKATSETSFFQDRGITQESIDKFNLGYDANFHEGTGQYSWKAAIFPTSSTTYEARNISVEPNSQDKGSYKCRKHGSLHIFNRAVLSSEKTKPIFVVEGIIDAISIIQSGGQAIGLGGTSGCSLLLKELDTITPAQPLILVLDNDDSGIKASESLQKELEKRKIPFMSAPNVIGKKYHDPNDRLLKDKEGLSTEVANAIKKAAELENPQDIARENYLQTSVSHSMVAFKQMIEQSAKRPILSTGFKAIDEALDGGLFSGLYIIGALSSLGKTTITLQIADNLAQQGRDVLFFSLEQSKFDLMSKSISRETYIYCKKHNINTKNAKSNLSILDGRRWEHFSSTEKKVVDEAFHKYEAYSKHLFIHEGIGNISVQTIKETIKQHISFTGNKRPIVFIDYLQILKAADGDERATDKQIVDHNVTALKQLSRDFDIPIFAVSSLNRQSYSDKINMAAFKESGAIEYGSDVLIGLQLLLNNAPVSSDNINTAKDANPRHVGFVILKNRNGKISSDPTGIILKYQAIHNYFYCSGESSNYDTVPIMEDNVPFCTSEDESMTNEDKEIAETLF